MKYWMRLILFTASLATSHAATRAIVPETRSDFACIKTALDAFAVDCGRYPTTTEGLAALVQRPATIDSARWHGPYLNGIPKDAWGHNYQYAFPSQHNTNGFDLYSCGFDGVSKSGGEDLDDINNWDPLSPHGGHDYLSGYGELFMQKFGGVIFLACLLVAMASLVHSISYNFSSRVRAAVERHPLAYSIWFGVWYVIPVCLYFYLRPVMMSH